MKTTVYSLLDPVEGLRYVGKTTQLLKKRLQGHLQDAKSGAKGHRPNWIRLLLAQGLQPAIVWLDEIEGELEGYALEAAYIQFHREEGYNLVNDAPGGEGFSSGARHPNFGKPGLRLGLTSWNKGISHTEETREKIRLAKLGISRSLESRAKQGAALKGRPSRMRGKKHSPEAKARMSETHKAAPNSGVFKSGMIPWNKGQPGKSPSLETRARMSVSQLRNVDNWNFKPGGAPWNKGKKNICPQIK